MSVAICSMSSVPITVTNARPAPISPNSTSPVAEPRRQPRFTKRFTAGSSASDRNNDTSSITSSDCNRPTSQRPNVITTNVTQKSTIARGTHEGMRSRVVSAMVDRG